MLFRLNTIIILCSSEIWEEYKEDTTKSATNCFWITNIENFAIEHHQMLGTIVLSPNNVAKYFITLKKISFGGGNSYNVQIRIKCQEKWFLKIPIWNFKLMSERRKEKKMVIGKKLKEIMKN